MCLQLNRENSAQVLSKGLAFEMISVYCEIKSSIYVRLDCLSSQKLTLKLQCLYNDKQPYQTVLFILKYGSNIVSKMDFGVSHTSMISKIQV